MSQNSFDLFCLLNKRLLLDFLRKWGWFHGHNESFPKYLRQKLKFQIAETQFCRWKSTYNNSIQIFLALENPCTFLLAKEKTWKCIFNTTRELLQNCTEKQITLSKTTINWLFNDIWYYLVISCFDWKNGVFQQSVVRVYYILKGCASNVSIFMQHLTSIRYPTLVLLPKRS